MGFMRGVPFFWSLHLTPVLMFNMALLLFIFIIWWTMFSGRKNGELQEESQDQSGNAP